VLFAPSDLRDVTTLWDEWSCGRGFPTTYWICNGLYTTDCLHSNWYMLVFSS